jgi:hypothetical protein
MAAIPVNHGGAPQEWKNSFWDCFSPGSTCEFHHMDFTLYRVQVTIKKQLLTEISIIGLMSCCCPCIVYGKNHERLKDPQGPEQNGINGSVSTL